MQQEEDSSRQAPQFSMHEMEEFKKFARQPNAQQRIFDMIAPQIFGSESIKKAIACLLFGGSRKVCVPCNLEVHAVPCSVLLCLMFLSLAYFAFLSLAWMRWNPGCFSCMHHE